MATPCVLANHDLKEIGIYKYKKMHLFMGTEFYRFNVFNVISMKLGRMK